MVEEITIGKRLRNVRTKLHLSQEYVATQMSLNRTAIGKIEDGTREVSAEEIGRFSKLYGVSVDELLYGNDDTMPEQMFARRFKALDDVDKNEILSLMEFKKMMKANRNK